jgi:hypothetical protein
MDFLTYQPSHSFIPDGRKGQNQRGDKTKGVWYLNSELVEQDQGGNAFIQRHVKSTKVQNPKYGHCQLT